MNRHIKVINGRKYYYSSIRKGKKVTSKYLGPVERIRKTRKKFLEEQLAGQMQELTETENTDEQNTPGEEDSYIG
jgi:hypothetical protein